MSKNLNIFTLKNKNGLTIEFANLGGRINSIKIPDLNNSFVDIALGSDSHSEMLSGDPYIGAICGRFANRISNGKFKIEGTGYQLSVNNGRNHIHGGENGFHTKFWNVEKITDESFLLKLKSEDGDEFYPGNLDVSVKYSLTENNEFVIDIEANTDKATPINITSHAYFNLLGFFGDDVLDHHLEINSQYFTPLSETGVPSGEIRKVAESVMDFSTPKQLSVANNSEYEQIKLAGGIDHNWVLNKLEKNTELAARLTHPATKRAIEVYTTQPGLQVYTGIHFNGMLGIKNKIPFQKFCGVALEPQNFPDAPNKPNFPKSILFPDETYKETIIYKFLW